MATSVIIHIENEDPVLGEVESLPDPTDQLVKVTNPRMRDGKDLQYLRHGVVTVIWPVRRINFIQVMPSEEEDQIIGFVRE